ncbi:hypothetical protein [Staphylococcus phage ESa1]|nr:hypothetical protein [Staphylococcus phage ESa1]
MRIKDIENYFKMSGNKEKLSTEFFTLTKIYHVGGTKNKKIKLFFTNITGKEVTVTLSECDREEDYTEVDGKIYQDPVVFNIIKHKIEKEELEIKEEQRRKEKVFKKIDKYLKN